MFYSSRIKLEAHCTIDGLLRDEFKLFKTTVK